MFVEMSFAEKILYKNNYVFHEPIGWWVEEGKSSIVLKQKHPKGNWTPFNCLRDCGDHYIFARYDRYDRIDKETGKVTRDVEDV